MTTLMPSTPVLITKAKPISRPRSTSQRQLNCGKTQLRSSPKEGSNTRLREPSKLLKAQSIPLKQLEINTNLETRLFSENSLKRRRSFPKSPKLLSMKDKLLPETRLTTSRCQTKMDGQRLNWLMLKMSSRRLRLSNLMLKILEEINTWKFVN